MVWKDSAQVAIAKLITGKYLVQKVIVEYTNVLIKGLIYSLIFYSWLT